VWVLQTDVRRLVRLDKHRAAAQRFVDYWSGAGAFRKMSQRAQDSVTTMVPKVAAEFAALISNPIAKSDLRELSVPTLLLHGESSPASTRDITRLLAGILPCRQLLGFPGLGHMGPVEDPQRVNASIAAFVGRHSVPGYLSAPAGSAGGSGSTLSWR
jgi:pimeloyl-ACP methyl ester carboxylesterase